MPIGCGEAFWASQEQSLDFSHFSFQLISLHLIASLVTSPQSISFHLISFHLALLYGYGPKDQASREPGTCRFLCLNSDLEGKEKQWLKRLASSKVLEEDVSRTYGKPGGPASPAPRFTLRIHPFSGG